MQVLQLLLYLGVPSVMHPLGEEVLASLGEGALPYEFLDRATKFLVPCLSSGPSTLLLPTTFLGSVRAQRAAKSEEPKKEARLSTSRAKAWARNRPLRSGAARTVLAKPSKSLSPSHVCSRQNCLRHLAKAASTAARHPAGT